MRRTLGFGLSLVLLAASSGFAGKSGESFADAESDMMAIEKTLDGVFAAMRARDSEALLALMGPETPIVQIADDGTINRSTGQQFALALGALDFEPRQILVGSINFDLDGAMATVRAPYEFHSGEVYSHCGVNVFHLVRSSDGWRVAAFIYSARETCGGDRK